MKLPIPTKAQWIAAAHTYWQFFVVAFGGSYAAAGIDYSQINDLSSLKRLALALLGAAAAAALSALKAVVKNIGSVYGGKQWTNDEIEAALAALADPAPLAESQLSGSAALAGVPPPAEVEDTPAPSPVITSSPTV